MIMDDNERYKNQLKKTNVRIHDHSTMHNFLKQNMPGKWSPMHITKLVQRLPGNERFLIKETGMTECVKTVEDEVKRLLEVVNLSEICSILGGGAGRSRSRLPPSTPWRASSKSSSSCWA